MSLAMQNATHGHTSPPSPGPAERRAQNPPPRVRRRNRLITSCLECRRRKLKCDKGQPCANCTKNSRQCVFIASGLDPDAQAKLAEVKEKMGILERSLEEDVARNNYPKRDAFDIRRPSTLPGQEESYSDQEDDEDTRGLNPTIYATEDASYYDDDANDDVVDLGIAMGKVRITERIGGLVRPRFSEELTQALKGFPKSERPNPYPVSEQDPQSWLAPSQDYVAPSSSFFFAPGVEKTSVMTYLPAKPLVDKLIAHYWDAVHAIARTVHRPSFERQYERFWANIEADVEPRISFQAVVFAALLSSIISMPEPKVLSTFRVDKQSLVDNFRQGTEGALARANFLRTTKIETLQAFVMYLIPLCRNEMSRAHSALTGMCIRLAECMGLHRDPTAYSNSPIEVHVRRLIWYQICFLDLRTCEATGPRPQIRPDDYDTRFPLNIDEDDLDRAEHGDDRVDVTTDRSHFTGMTITRMRFECYEMHRFLWTERPKVERKTAIGDRKVTLASLLSRVQSFMAAMERTYLPMLTKSEPLHVLASEIYGILSNRLYILLLQRYLSSDHNKMPPRLRQVVLSSAIMVLEDSMVIEQQPMLSTWAWYVGALHQYHTALLLLKEIWASHNDPAVETRAWRCMDYAFGLSPERSRQEKTRSILEDLVDKTEIYAGMKKVRAPTNMPHAESWARTATWQDSERSGSTQSGSVGSANSGYGGTAVPATQHTSPPGQLDEYQASYQHGVPAFGMGVPNTDWGIIELPSTTTNIPHQQFGPEAYNFGNFPPATSAVNLMPTSMVALGAGQRHESDASSPGAAIYGGIDGGTTNSSPMDALNEIDWNDMEQMFPGLEMQAGMYIPPFTFPQFSPGDLPWIPEGM